MFLEYVTEFVDNIHDSGIASGNAQPPKILVPAEVCQETARGLRSHSPPSVEHEGVVYWAGTTDEDSTVKLVHSVLVPEAVTTPGSYDVSPVGNAAIIEAIHQYDVELIATVHSHPGQNTTHSNRDNKEAQLPHEGYYSIVVPRYARDGLRPFTKCGVHVYRNGKFHKLNSPEVESAVEAIPSPPTYIDTRSQ